MKDNSSIKEIYQEQRCYLEEPWRDWIIMMVIKRQITVSKRTDREISYRNLTVVDNEFNHYGLLEIKFSDSIYKPCFLDDRENKRNLKSKQEMIELDVENQFLKCTYKFNSEIDPSHFKFDLQLLKW